jgi:cardiolipin synthase
LLKRLSKEKSKSYDAAMPPALTIANLLTILRLILIPVFVTALYYQQFKWALVVFFVAAVTDGLDGLVARSLNQKTQLGAILDPMADKLLLVTAFVILSLPRFTLTDPIPFWLTAVAISRDAIIVLGAAVINMTTGFKQFRPSIPGKLNTLVQIVMIVFVLLANAFGLAAEYLPVVYYATLGMAVFSGLHYIAHINRLMNEDQPDVQPDVQPNAQPNIQPHTQPHTQEDDHR